MSIKNLIKELKKVEDQNRQVSVIVGNDDYNSLIFDEFEIHNTQEDETSIEIFCFDEYRI